MESGRPDSSKCLGIAGLGLSPLLAGAIIYRGWIVTKVTAPWIVFAGVMTTVIGFCFVVTGLVLLYIRWPNGSASKLSSWLTLVLLLSNFPAAAFCYRSAWSRMTAHHLTAVNRSGRTIRSLRLSGPGVAEALGPISPGAQAETVYWPQRKGEVTYAIEWERSTSTGLAEGYVDPGLGASFYLIVDHDGRVGIGDILPLQEVTDKKCHENGGRSVSGIRPLECGADELFYGRIAGVKCACICCVPKVRHP
jgi:hypothetical protein